MKQRGSGVWRGGDGMEWDGLGWQVAIDAVIGVAIRKSEGKLMFTFMS